MSSLEGSGLWSWASMKGGSQLRRPWGWGLALGFGLGWVLWPGGGDVHERLFLSRIVAVATFNLRV